MENHNHNIEEVVTFLNTLLADEYVLYTKTRNAHWNVGGPHFFEFHVFLENQYNDLDQIIDDVADQIRSLGYYALGSMKDFLTITDIPEENHDFNNSGQIIQTLARSHDMITRMIRKKINLVSNEYKDPDTAELVTGLIKKHEKMAMELSEFHTYADFNAVKKNQIINTQVAD